MTKTSLPRSWPAVLSSGFAGLAVYFLLATQGDVRRDLMLFLLIAGSAWGLYASLGQKLCKVFSSAATARSDTVPAPTARRQAAVILLFALLYRLVILPTTPWLSHDIYRHIWDGRVLASSINPYQWPPNAPELASLRDEKVFPLITHSGVGTIYPPLLQFLFLVAHLLGGSVLAHKFVLLLVDAVLLLLVLGGLRFANRDPRLVVLYAWNPLPILEIAGSGHADGLLGLLLLLCVFMLGAGNVRRAALTIGAGFLVKFAGLLLLPYLWLAHRRRILDSTLMFSAVVLLGYLPFLTAGSAVAAGLITYASTWRFNDGLFSLIYWPIERLLPASLVQSLMTEPTWSIDAATLLGRRIDLALLIAKAVAAGLFFAWMALLMRRFLRTTRSLESWGPLVISLLAGLLLLAPTFHPWYMLWILPLLSIWPNRALLLLSGTVLLSYWTLHGEATAGTWRENSAVKWVEFTPVFAVMVYDYWREKRTGRKQT